MAEFKHPAEMSFGERAMCSLSGVTGVAVATALIALVIAAVVMFGHTYDHVAAVHKGTNAAGIGVISIFAVIVVGTTLYTFGEFCYKQISKWVAARRALLGENATESRFMSVVKLLLTLLGEVLGCAAVEAVLVPLWVKVALMYPDAMTKPDPNQRMLTWLIAFYVQFAVTMFGMLIWHNLDKRPLPSMFTRFWSLLTLSVLPLWGLHLGYWMTGNIEGWYNFLGFAGGVGAVVSVLGWAFGCPENLFQKLARWKARSAAPAVAESPPTAEAPETPPSTA